MVGMDPRTMPSGSVVLVTSVSIRAAMLASSGDCSAARTPGRNCGCADRPRAMASFQPAGAVKSMRSKIACRHSPALVPRGKRRMSSGAMSGGGAPIRFAASAIRASWSFAAASLFASLARPAEAAEAPRGRDRLRRGQGGERFRFGPGQRDRRAALRRAAGRGRGGASVVRRGPATRRRCRPAIASPSSQLRGDSLPPATSQLRRLFVLSVARALAEAVRRVRAGDHVAPIDRARQRHVDEAQRLGRRPRA